MGCTRVYVLLFLMLPNRELNEMLSFKISLTVFVITRNRLISPLVKYWYFSKTKICAFSRRLLTVVLDRIRLNGGHKPIKTLPVVSLFKNSGII